MFLYIGLLSKDHDRLQSLLWSVVRGARQERSQLEARNKYRTASKHTLLSASMFQLAGAVRLWPGSEVLDCFFEWRQGFRGSLRNRSGACLQQIPEC